MVLVIFAKRALVRQKGVNPICGQFPCLYKQHDGFSMAVVWPQESQKSMNINFRFTLHALRFLTHVARITKTTVYLGGHGSSNHTIIHASKDIPMHRAIFASVTEPSRNNSAQAWEWHYTRLVLEGKRVGRVFTQYILVSVASSGRPQYFTTSLRMTRFTVSL